MTFSLSCYNVKMMTEEEIREMYVLEVESMFYGYCSLSEEKRSQLHELEQRFEEENAPRNPTEPIQ